MDKYYLKISEDGAILGTAVNAFLGDPDEDWEECTEEEYQEAVARMEALPVHIPEPEELEDPDNPDDDRDEMLVDLVYRLTLLELGVNE